MRIKKLLPEQLLETIYGEMPKISSNIIDAFKFVVWAESRKINSTNEILHHLERQYGPRYVQPVKALISDFVANEVLTVCSACMVEDNLSNYVVAEKFYSEFKHLSLDGLRFTDLPDDFIGYIDLKDNEIEGASKFFIWIGSYEEYPVETDIQHSLEDHTDICINIGGLGKNTCFATKFIIPETPLTIKELFDAENTGSGPLIELVKLMIYIETGQPDIREFKNEIRYRGQGKKPVKKDRDLATGTINLVGFGWKKPVIYGLDSWPVKGFFRSQRHGPGNSLLKIIYIDEQVRSRNRDDTSCITRKTVD